MVCDMKTQKGIIFLSGKKKGKTFFRNSATNTEFWVWGNLEMVEGKEYSAEYIRYQRTHEVKMVHLEEVGV